MAGRRSEQEVARELDEGVCGVRRARREVAWVQSHDMRALWHALLLSVRQVGESRGQSRCGCSCSGSRCRSEIADLQIKPQDPYAHFRTPGFSCFEKLFDQEEIERFERETAADFAGMVLEDDVEVDDWRAMQGVW